MRDGAGLLVTATKQQHDGDDDTHCICECDPCITNQLLGLVQRVLDGKSSILDLYLC